MARGYVGVGGNLPSIGSCYDLDLFVYTQGPVQTANLTVGASADG